MPQQVVTCQCMLCTVYTKLAVTGIHSYLHFFSMAAIVFFQSSVTFSILFECLPASCIYSTSSSWERESFCSSSPPPQHLMKHHTTVTPSIAGIGYDQFCIYLDIWVHQSELSISPIYCWSNRFNISGLQAFLVFALTCF